MRHTRLRITAILLALLCAFLPLSALADGKTETVETEKTETETTETETTETGKTETVTEFTVGKGTEEEPYILSTAAELYLLAERVNGGESYYNTWFCLGADISLNDLSNLDRWDTEAPANEWTPIGTEWGRNFDGHFDGANHTVSGIYINAPETGNVGLFGYIGLGTLKNVRVTASRIRGRNSVGGVCGSSYSTKEFSGCFSDATVIGENYVGGVCGSCTAALYESSTVTDCENAGSVSGVYAVGGVVGAAETVLSCRNTGNVTGTDYGAGGVVGNGGEVLRCTNTGKVVGKNYVGGVLGDGGAYVLFCANSGDVYGSWEVGGVAGDALFIADCYNTGKIGGALISILETETDGKTVWTLDKKKVVFPETFGGIVGGYGSVAYVRNCYTLNDFCGANGIGRIAGAEAQWMENCYCLSETLWSAESYEIPTEPGAVTLTESAMRDAHSYVGFDFNNLWSVEPSTGYPYPQLTFMTDISLAEPSALWDGQAADAFAGGSGTEADPYRIETAAQLAYLAKCTNESDADKPFENTCFRLENDILLNDTSKKNWTRTAAVWTPIGIGEAGYGGVGFYGHLDGGGHTVRGLYTDGDADGQGLFGALCGTVENLTVADSFLYGKEQVGGICASLTGTVTNCTFTGTVYGMTDVGGIAGTMEGTMFSEPYIRRSTGAGRVFGLQHVGGVVGGNYGGECTDCLHTGTVGGADGIGGICGGRSVSGGTDCKRCENRGSVSGRYEIGGITGNAGGGKLYDCRNLADLCGYESVGGILGGGCWGIYGCVNEGNIRADRTAGGIAGNPDSGVEYCVNHGSVFAKDTAGGIVAGGGDGHTANCYNTGSVSGGGSVGGIVGYGGGIADAYIENCYSVGETDGKPILGWVGTVKNCYYPVSALSSPVMPKPTDEIEGWALLEEWMHGADAFVGFDFETVWEFGGTAEGYPYPTLRRTVTHAHIYPEEWTIDLAPTVSEAGEQSHHCPECGARGEITPLPALGDVDGIPGVSVSDALFTLRALLNGGEGVDLNGDGEFSLIDVLRLLRACAE